MDPYFLHAICHNYQKHLNTGFTLVRPILIFDTTDPWAMDLLTSCDRLCRVVVYAL